MSNDELLAKVELTLGTYISKYYVSKKDVELRSDVIDSLQALRAVVELHKPVQGRSDITTYDYIGCDACVEWSHDGNMNLRYPCPTIQAITDNLK